MKRTERAHRQLEPSETAPRSRWRVARDRIAAHPRIAIAIVVVVFAALAWGGYRFSRDHSFQHHLLKAQPAMDDGDYAAALSELGECHRIRPNDPEIHLLLARAHWMDGNRSQAARHLTVGREAGGDTERLALEIQLLGASAGDIDPVELALRKHLDAGHPERRVILEALVRGFVGRGRAEDAERLATLWVEDAPLSWKPYFYRGVARTLLSKDLLSTAHDAAKRDFHRVVELKPDHDMARLLLGNAYVMNGQFREALPHLEHYCRLKPGDAQGQSALAGCHRALGQIEDARRVVDDWLKSNTGTAEVFLVRGEIALDIGKPEEALDFFRRAQALAPSLEKADFQIAAALRALGRAEEAGKYEAKWSERNKLKDRLKELEQVAARAPGIVAVHHEAGTIALRLGNELSGMRSLAQALKLDPNHQPTHEFLADYFTRKGNLDAATFHRRLAEKLPK